MISCPATDVTAKTCYKSLIGLEKSIVISILVVSIVILRSWQQLQKTRHIAADNNNCTVQQQR
jgi:hypothetical protein